MRSLRIAWEKSQKQHNGKPEGDGSALEVTLTREKRVHPVISATEVRRESQRERTGLVKEWRLKHIGFHHLKVSFFLLPVFHC